MKEAIDWVIHIPTLMKVLLCIEVVLLIIIAVHM